MTNNVVVIGTQWGDEGKGKIVDWLTDHADAVVRFQGGHNAGHTLVIGQGKSQKEYKLNLVPSGIIRPKIQCFIGNGVVLDINHLENEVSSLEKDDIDVKNRLFVSYGCPLILNYHISLDQAREAKRDQNKKIGTTGKGIGPAYEDKVARRSLKVYDLLEPDRIHDKLEDILDLHNFVLKEHLDTKPIDFKRQLDEIYIQAEFIKPLVCDVSDELYKINSLGKKILFEGAQGALLDIDHGTYPFVTSSNCVAGQAAAGSGIGPQMLEYILGITKAYTTRVGSGPFPTEEEGKAGVSLGKKGHEFGTVTGRQRRCGWFDSVLVKQAVSLSSINGIALTKLDVLDGFKEIKICSGYSLDGKILNYLPSSEILQKRIKPIYEVFKGWKGSIVGLKDHGDLPEEAKIYIKRIEELVGSPVILISTSPERADTIYLKDPFNLN